MRIVTIVASVLLAVSCAPPALITDARKGEILLSLQRELARSVEGEKSAVLATSDEDSERFAAQSRKAAEQVDQLRVELRGLLTSAPDGDDVNERFEPRTACPLQEFHLQIFDRIGTMIFETTDIDVTWGADGGNGYYVADGIYHYTLKYAWGESQDSSISRVESGSITVIR